MTREVETYKTVFINNKFENDENTFSKNINVEFIPDEIVVKYICVNDDNTNTETGIYTLKTNLIREEDLITFPAFHNFSQQVDIPFKNYDRINGTYSFKLGKLDETAIAELDTMDLSLSLVLLFVKFKSE